MDSKIVARFWYRVNKDGPVPAHMPRLGRCWIWTGGVAGRGYGYMRRGGARDGMEYAHRVSWFIASGEIAPRTHVLHRCDTPRCVNPAHLFIGTQADNMRDCVAKGRSGWFTKPERVPRGDRSGARLHPEAMRRGSRHYRAKLTEHSVVAMRGEYAAGNISQRDIAKKNGISLITASRIIRRVSWKHC